MFAGASSVPDPEAARKKAAEVAEKAKNAFAKSQKDLMKVRWLRPCIVSNCN